MSDNIDSIKILNEIKKMEKLANEIRQLKNIYRQRRPIFIEFCGSPKSGKSSCINSLNLFLKRNKFKTKVLTERASICPIPSKIDPFFNIWTTCAAITEITTVLTLFKDDVDIIIADRGIFDSLCWFEWLYKKGSLAECDYNTLNDFLLMKNWRQCIDLVYVFRASPQRSLEREYANLLTRIEGSIMNEKVLNQYLESIESARDKYASKFQKVEVIDTSELNQNDVNAKVTHTSLDIIKYLLIEKIGYFRIDLKERLQPGINDYKILEDFELEFDERDLVENDDYIQPIPVAILTDKNLEKVLVIKKHHKNVSKTSPEKDKLLIYAGGHVRKEDQLDNSMEETFIDCLKRELKEELGHKFLIDDQVPFLIYTPESIKSSKHLAICYLLKLEELDNLKLELDSYELVQKKGQSKSGTFVKTSELLNNSNELESWSKIILKNIFNKKVRELELFDY